MRHFIRAEKFEYAAGALTRRLRLNAHARALAALIRRYQGGVGRWYILVNGILTDPGAHDAWTDAGVTWLHTRAPATEASGVVLVGHSNGAEVICRALREVEIGTRGSSSLQGRHPVAEVHLIAPACEADFDRNGLNAALEYGRVGAVHVYMSGQDRALRLARWSRRLFGWLGLGYGDLGLRGPVNAAGRVFAHREATFGHSTWFAGAEFERTMQRILAAGGGPMIQSGRYGQDIPTSGGGHAITDNSRNG
jgi:hypothetical protein